MPRFLPLSVVPLMLVGFPFILLAQIGAIISGSTAVPEMNVEQLLKLNAESSDGLHETSGQHLIVDVRGPEEYQVSMIPGAITKEQFERNKSQYRHRTIVVYCTIGYRSGQYAKKLISDGFTAKNFKGSIVTWCQAGLPLMTMHGEPTNRVHTYSSQYKVPAKYTAVY